MKKYQVQFLAGDDDDDGFLIVCASSIDEAIKKVELAHSQWTILAAYPLDEEK